MAGLHEWKSGECVLRGDLGSGIRPGLALLDDHSMNECDQFVGRKRAICAGLADLPLEGPNSINAYRRRWGLPPLDCRGEFVEATPPVEPPPLMIQGWNFARALARWALAGMPRRSDAEIEDRLAICQACEFLQDSHCVQCGCACLERNQVLNKLALATEHCPLEKW